MGAFDAREAAAGKVSGTRPRSRRILYAWLVVACCIGLVLWLGSEALSVHATYGKLDHVLRFLFPDWSTNDRWRAQIWIRKSAHVAEYAVLALLTLRAMWISFESLIVRLAAASLLLALAVAAVDESRQATLDTRTGSITDVLIDISGAFAALCVAVFFIRRVHAQRARTTSEQPAP